MLSHASLSKDFWALAISTAYYLMNHSPSIGIEYMMPEEIWSNNLADYILRVFGCLAYIYIDDGKLEPIAKKCIFLSYASRAKG